LRTRAWPGINNISGDANTAISLLESIAFLEKLKSKKPDLRFGSERNSDL
jgi:hypothetical protein